MNFAISKYVTNQSWFIHDQIWDVHSCHTQNLYAFGIKTCVLAGRKKREYYSQLSLHLHKFCVLDVKIYSLYLVRINYNYGLYIVPFST